MQKYIHSTEVHNEADPGIVVPYLMELLHPGSVVDVGCGRGTWLSVFAKHGVPDIFGLDSPLIDRTLLTIREGQFQALDLSEPFTLPRRFDVAMSLEVAEHLPASSADAFLDSLTALSDVVLFAAAIPYQGGQGHVNEQWKTWWADRFRHRGYIPIDILREKLWKDERLFYWYRQNMFLAVRKEHPLAGAAQVSDDIVHPALWEKRSTQFRAIKDGRIGVIIAAKIFAKSLLSALRLR
jgi:hypothetical protein